jgi:hypothetical protein
MQIFRKWHMVTAGHPVVAMDNDFAPVFCPNGNDYLIDEGFLKFGGVP